MDSFACDVLINPGLRQYKFGHFVLGEFPLWLVAEQLTFFVLKSQRSSLIRTEVITIFSKR